MKVLGIGIAIAGFFLAMAWGIACTENAKATIAKACIENGGSFSYSWNWKPICEKK